MANQKRFIKKQVKIWGGIECTINRVQNQYRDQLEYSGHYGRCVSDLEAIADLGIKTLRYPLLLERIAPESLDNPDWAWADEQINTLKRLDICPIIGLVHHGSGPKYGTFEHHDFAEIVGKYASMVAARYPHITHYTPINEPLTTARFAGLYGLWYPHQSNNKAFLNLFFNQSKATVLAMQAIRKIQPNALLIQTEDLGQTHSTAPLAYQAEFENHRRWLTFDVLSGRLRPGHSLWDYCLENGVELATLQFFIDNVCLPDVLGINHYLTGERFLDHRLDHYPPHLHGSNGKHIYADTEAVRMGDLERAGLENLICQTARRYPNTAIAITECHLGCTREEQMRWFWQCYQSANKLASQGIQIEAITAWAMLGSTDWNSLLTCNHNYYENGVFDLRTPNNILHKTGLAGLINQINQNNIDENTLVVCDQPGWWQKPERITYLAAGHTACATHVASPDSSRPLLILGATGTLGQALAKVCRSRGIGYKLLSRKDLDICNPEQIWAIISEFEPWAIVNAAGYVRVAQAENDAKNCYNCNTFGPHNLSIVCAKLDLPLLTFSSDLVFDGNNNDLIYLETDLPNPQTVYGNSKAKAEELVLETWPKALIIRTSAFFGPDDIHNFAHHFLQSWYAHQPLDACAASFISPTYVPDLANQSINLLLDRAAGIFHLANKGQISWAGFGRMLALKAGIDQYLIANWYDKQLAIAAHKPITNTVLGSQKIAFMPSLEDAVNRYVYETQKQQVAVGVD